MAFNFPLSYTLFLPQSYNLKQVPIHFFRVLKSVQTEESLTKTCLTRLKKLQIMRIWNHLAALTEALLTRCLFSLSWCPIERYRRLIQILWRYSGPQGVLRIIKNCCVESQQHSGQMHLECCYCCEVSMNNIKALLGCFRGSRQLGQTLAK